MFTKEQLAKWRELDFEFDDFYDSVAVDKKEEELIIINNKESENESIYSFVYDDDSVIINKTKYDYNEIKQRVEKIKTKIKSFYEELSDEEKLIIDLPLIQWNLNYKHGAVMIIHWLEGTQKSIKLDYSFFTSENRVKDVDKNNLKSYLKDVKYLSVESLGYYPSNPDGVNMFLYNDSIPSIKKALDLFNKKLSSINTNSFIGDFNNLATHIDDKVVIKENLFQSFSIGSAIGNFDDIGTALGRYSYRVYFKGVLNKNEDLNKWILNIESIGGRFIDEFSFNDNKEWFNPVSWKSQSLGCWKHSVEEPSVSRLKSPVFSSKICLENQDFLKLKEKAKKKGVNIGGDFLIYSDIKEIKDEFVKKSILI